MACELPIALYNCEQTRTLDRLAMSKANIPGIVLMKRAGRAAFNLLLARWPGVEKIVVFCGGGNNGGDGYIVAGLAAAKNISVDVFSTCDVVRLSGDAALAKDFALENGVDIAAADAINWSEYAEQACTVFVDAILGIGFKGELKEDLSDLFADINRVSCPLLALDIPSGLNGDTGGAAENALLADATVTFVGAKQGLLTGKGPAISGDVYFDDLAIPSSIYTKVPSSVSRAVARHHTLPERPADAHKKDFGHVLVVGGDIGMGGAAMMAAEAALRCGAGLVTVATRPEHVSAILARLPEVMAVGVTAGAELESLLERADVVVVGPGLGQSAWSEQLLYFALQNSLAKILDADALNLIAMEKWDLPEHRRWIMTPHPGEASRLLGCSTSEVQADRFRALQALQQKFSCSVLLKGAGTLVADGEHIHVANVGNPGMAVAGMGDVLSGVLGALLAQGMAPDLAARVGVLLHGAAGDRAAEDGLRGVRATDLMLHLRCLVNG